jgi:peptide/nickel transport system permease protein
MIEKQTEATRTTGEAVTPIKSAPHGRPSWSRRLFAAWRLRPTFLWGSLALAAIIVVATLAPVIAPYDPSAQNLSNALQPPNGSHWFGTDNYGRDIFSRVLHATWLDLEIGILGVLFAFLFGILLGCLAGYLGGWVDNLIMRTTDVFFAFPFTVLTIGFIAMLGPGLRNMVITFTLSGWTAYARLVRGEILVVRRLEYITAAQALGLPSSRIMLHHILPNVITSGIIFAMADIVLVILSAASLSFLGLGIQPPTPEWGAMIAEGRIFLLRAWWPVTLPGFAVVLTAVALSLVGDGIADLLRPSSN